MIFPLAQINWRNLGKCIEFEENVDMEMNITIFNKLFSTFS
jgi:hypothetical protein